ncbi:MAG: hypothetical protein J5654_05600 [Victivallales bacterium]|nr:hypothetical protein [Victivallales bacterium]
MPKAIFRETREKGEKGLHHACHLRTLVRRGAWLPGHSLVRSMVASPGMDFACFACFAGNTTRQPSAVGNHDGKLTV